MFAIAALSPVDSWGSAPDRQTCAHGAAASAGNYEHKLQSGGYERSYRVHVPTGEGGSRPMPVVLAFHGGYGTGKFMQRQTLLDQVADRHGFLAVFPDGLWKSWNAGGCCGPAMKRDVDDVGFVHDLLNDLAGHYCVDRRRVYATGFSNGSMLVHRLACELSGEIAAIAPVSGVIMVPPCRPPNPTPVLVFHGTDDPRSLWEGGLGDKHPSKGVRESIPRTMERLYTRYRCMGELSTVLQTGAVTCKVRRGCDAGAEVGLCRIEGGGHQWPGGTAVWTHRLGKMNTDVSGSEVMWEFFERHQRKQGSN